MVWIKLLFKEWVFKSRAFIAHIISLNVNSFVVLWTFYTSLSFSTSLLHLANMPCWIHKNLNLYLGVMKKKDEAYQCKIPNGGGITKFILWWFVFFMRVFSIDCVRLWETIHGQHTPQIETIVHLTVKAIWLFIGIYFSK